MSRNATPPPNMAGLTDDFQRMARLRQQREEQRRQEEQERQQQGQSEAAAPQARPQPEMTRRSWYVTKDAADTLRAAVDDIHHRTRGIPKHVILSELLTRAASQADIVTRDLLADITRDTGATGDTSHA